MYMTVEFQLIVFTSAFILNLGPSWS